MVTLLSRIASTDGSSKNFMCNIGEQQINEICHLLQSQIAPKAIYISFVILRNVCI